MTAAVTLMIVLAVLAARSYRRHCTARAKFIRLIISEAPFRVAVEVGMRAPVLHTDVKTDLLCRRMRRRQDDLDIHWRCWPARQPMPR